MLNPKVSVATITYGQQDYILETIKGVLFQQYNGEIEFIITNDNSPDNTDNVIKKFLATTNIPTNITIKYIKHEKNKGAIPNFAWTLEQCTGKYIAICEGDDYWTDPLKLQKQVNFLEANKDYVLCFHKVNILTEEGIKEDFITTIPENYEERKTLVQEGNYIHTPSVIFRNILQDEYKTLEFRNTPIGDYFLYLLLTKHGKIGFLPETMVIYRHGVGIYSNVNKYKHAKMNILLFTNLYAIEKDDVIKNIFYEQLNYLIDCLVVDASNSALLGTRRHKVLEDIYKKIKRK